MGGFKISRFEKEIRAEIEILASAERVWQLLADFGAYPDWNPYFREVSGKAKIGEKLKVFMKPEWEKKGTTLRPRILRLEPKKELTWAGSYFLPGLLDVEHSFILEKIGTRRVRFIQKEKYRGLALPFITVSWSIEKGMSKSLREMNSALKKRAEKRY